MASSSNDASNDVAVSDADLAQIFTQIAKGEKTAQALESNLDSLEKKIDALLASFEESERRKVEEANGKLPKAPSGGNGEGKS